jgi:hypothetical protein
MLTGWVSCNAANVYVNFQESPFTARHQLVARGTLKSLPSDRAEEKTRSSVFETCLGHSEEECGDSDSSSPHVLPGLKK